jgi:hypothetical protein
VTFGPAANPTEKPVASSLKCLAARSNPLTWEALESQPVSVCEIQPINQRTRPDFNLTEVLLWQMIPSGILD